MERAGLDGRDAAMEARAQRPPEALQALGFPGAPPDEDFDEMLQLLDGDGLLAPETQPFGADFGSLKAEWAPGSLRVADAPAGSPQSSSAAGACACVRTASRSRMVAPCAASRPQA